MRLRQEARHQGLETASHSHNLRSGLPTKSSRDELHLQLLSAPRRFWLTRSTNELRYLAAKLASRHSYRQAAAVLHDLLCVCIRGSATYQSGQRPWTRVVVWIRIRFASRLRIGGGFAQHHAASRSPLTVDTLGGQEKGRIATSRLSLGEIDGKIWVFATAHKAVAGLKRRLGALVNRLHIDSERPIALMTDGAESLLRLRTFAR
jgi:hypothetical protein